MSPRPPDSHEPSPLLSVVIVSHRSDRWLTPCLSSLEAHAKDVLMEVVVIENGGSTTSQRLAESHPRTRWATVPNRGFAAATNHGVGLTTAPYVLLLNPDTEVVVGDLSTLLDALENQADVGAIGVRQVGPDGQLLPTIRRFPTALRWLGESAGSERWPIHPTWAGERELDMTHYAVPRTCDWTVGSFLLDRRAAYAAVGGMHEGFFLYYEEPDLCLRLARAGWRTEHRPEVTIVHYGGSESADPGHAAQLAYAKRVYMRRHFSRPSRIAATAALGLGYGARAVVGSRERSTRRASRARACTALLTLFGIRPSPLIVQASGLGPCSKPCGPIAH